MNVFMLFFNIVWFLFQQFVKFCCSGWNILLYNITVPVNKKCERNGVELKLVGEEIPFVGREEEVLALNAVVGEELLAWLARRVLFVADVEETHWGVFVFIDECALLFVLQRLKERVAWCGN